MKRGRIPFVLFALSFVLAVAPTTAISGPADDGTVDAMEISIEVSPRTIVLDSSITWVTVHTDIPYHSVACASLTMNGVPVAWTKSDLRGYLVAKFTDESIKEIVDPPSADLTLSGVTVGGVAFSGTTTVRVIQGGKK